MVLINRRNQSYIVMLAFKLIDKQMVSFKIPLSKLEVGQASLETIFPQGNENIPLQMAMSITEKKYFFFKFGIKNLKRKHVSWWHLPMFQMRFFSLSDSARGSSGGKNWWVVMTALLPTDLSLSLSPSLWKNWWVLTTLLPICIFCGHSLFRKTQKGPCHFLPCTLIPLMCDEVLMWC